MSYDIRLVPQTDDGTPPFEIGVTYNYSKFYYDKIDRDDGIRAIYGLTGAESLPILDLAISLMSDEGYDPMDYWKPTEGNARDPLKKLFLAARSHPTWKWEGD